MKKNTDSPAIVQVAESKGLHARHTFGNGKRFPVSTEWRVELAYRLVPDFYGLDRKVIFPAAAAVVGGKGYSGGSGAGFGDRDHDWSVKDRQTAVRLARALKKVADRLPSPRIVLRAPPKVVLDVAVTKAKV